MSLFPTAPNKASDAPLRGFKEPPPAKDAEFLVLGRPNSVAATFCPRGHTNHRLVTTPPLNRCLRAPPAPLLVKNPATLLLLLLLWVVGGKGRATQQPGQRTASKTRARNEVGKGERLPHVATHALSSCSAQKRSVDRSIRRHQPCSRRRLSRATRSNTPQALLPHKTRRQTHANQRCGCPFLPPVNPRLCRTNQNTGVGGPASRPTSQPLHPPSNRTGAGTLLLVRSAPPPPGTANLFLNALVSVVEDRLTFVQPEVSTPS